MHGRFDFNYITETVKKALILNGLFLTLMSVFRLVFLVYFSDFSDFKGLSPYLIKALILGVRYDLVVIAYLNTFVTLSLIAAWTLKSRKIFNKWLKGLEIYYIFMYSLVFFVLFVDFGFYSYFKNHINIIIFGFIEDDTFALITTIAKNRALPVALAALFALEFVIFKAARKMTVSIKDSLGSAHSVYPSWFSTVFFVLLLMANALGARGSLKMFPLGTIDAAISPNSFINKLSLNGFFTLGEAIESRWNEDKGTLDIAKMTGYEGNIEKAFKDYLNNQNLSYTSDLLKNLVRHTAKNTLAERIKPNVILIVLEGFGADLLNYNSPDFNVLGELKKHFNSDYVFYNFLPGDIGTIGSLESIFLNLPKRPQSKAITQSKYAFVPFVSGAAVPYKNAGYDTIFVYGGNLGWRNLLSFVPLQGFDTADGEGAMPSGALKNEWGVYDQYLFDYIYKKLSAKNGKPKFIMAMSTGNHPPYSVPKDYRMLPLNMSGLLEKRVTGDRSLAKKRFGTYQYANQKLGELITRIKRSEYGRNTIIAVTGDHNFWDVFDYDAEHMMDRFSVPLYIYVPSELKANDGSRPDTKVFGSHIDIMPTLYNLSLSRAAYVALGSDLFDAKVTHMGFISEGYIFSKHGGAYCSIARDISSYYVWDKAEKRKLIQSDKTPELGRILNRYKAALAVTDYLIKKSK